MIQFKLDELPPSARPLTPSNRNTVNKTPPNRQFQSDLTSPNMDASNKIFELDIASAKIPALFATCVQCFEFSINNATSCEAGLQLSILRMRLTRWGHAVNIYVDTDLKQQDAEPKDLQEVRSLVVQMLRLFALAFKEVRPVPHPVDPTWKALPVFSALESIALERSPKGKTSPSSRGLRLTRWSDTLPASLSTLIGKLEDLFPLTRVQSDLCAWDRIKLDGHGALKAVEAAALGMDPWIEWSKSRAAAISESLAKFDVVVGAPCHYMDSIPGFDFSDIIVGQETGNKDGPLERCRGSSTGRAITKDLA